MAETTKPKIRSVYRPTQSEIDAIAKVYKRKEFMRQGRSEFETQWDHNEKQYEAYKKDLDLEDWQSDYFVPITTSIIESILAEMVDQSPRPFVIPSSDPNDRPKAKILENIFEYTWDIGDGDIELYKIMKDALVFGTGIAQESYLSIPRTVKQIVKYDKTTGKEVYEEKELNDFDDVIMESVKLQDFYVDEAARYFGKGSKSARDCIRRFIMHIDDFHSQYKGKIWDPLGNASKVKAGGDTNYYEFFKPPQDLEGNQVEVLWYWNKPDDELIITANDILIRKTPNPYRHKQLPFARAVDIMRSHNFYGKGEADLLESINEELNRMRRMRQDRAHLSIDQMFLVSSKELIDEAQLIARPHGKIEVDSVPVNQAIQPLVYPDTPQSSYMEEDRIKEDAVRVTGMDDRLQSVQKATTATEAAILKEATLKRIRTKMRLLERDFLTQIGRLRISNIQQFYSLPKVKQVVGENGVSKYQPSYRTIRTVNKELKRTPDGNIVEVPTKGTSFFTVNPDMLSGDFDVRIEAGSTLPISKPLMQSKMTEMIDRLLPLALQGVGYDPVKIMDKYIEVNDYDPDDFKSEPAAPDQTQQGGPQSQIELANVENENMMNGEDITSTPYAEPGHTEIHIAFMTSPSFKEQIGGTEDPRLQIFTKHVTGEIMAQGQGGQAGQVPVEGQMPVGQMSGNPMNVQMNLPQKQAPSMVNAAMPAKVTGNIEGRPTPNGMGPGTIKRSPFKGKK